MANSKTLLSVAAAALMCGAASSQAQVTVQVTPDSPGSWAIYTLNGGTGGFESGPDIPPGGTGSAFEILSSGTQYSAFRSTAYDGVKLSELTSLTYHTSVAANQNCQASYINLLLDNNNDGEVDDSISFEPCYQTGGYGMVAGAGPIDPQCEQSPPPGFDPGDCFLKNKWYSWNALAGGWWADSVVPPGPPLDTIASYLDRHHDATIRNYLLGYEAQVLPPINKDSSSNWPARSKGGIPIMFKLFTSVLGGLKVAAGNGWQPFDGNFDKLTVGVNGVTTTYDFDGAGSAPVAGEPTRTCNLPEATIGVDKIGANDTLIPVNEIASRNAFDTGNVFRVVDCKYQYILAIQSLQGAGRYRVEIKIAGNTIGTAMFDLK